MITIKAILDFLTSKHIQYQATISGDLNQIIKGFSALNQYESDTMTWVKKRKNIPDDFDMKKVALVFLQEDLPTEAPNRIITNYSKQAFFQTIEYFFAREEEIPEIGSGTYISPQVRLGKDVKIGHHCVLDGNITIGEGTRIYHNVTILNHVEIGRNCTIQSGVVVGHDGFGYYEDSHNGTKSMIKHYGGVLIGDNVHIGSNCNITRGTLGNTVIKDGCKIDTLCHIAHNVEIQENVVIITGASIYGSVKIGKNAYVSESIIKNQSVIGQDAFVGMGSVVISDVTDHTTVVGNPARKLKRKATQQD